MEVHLASRWFGGSFLYGEGYDVTILGHLMSL
jgi:hypothetical protein